MRPLRAAALAFFLLPAACSDSSLREPSSMREIRSGGMSLQSQEFTCGAAALATTLTALGVPVRESDVLHALLEDTARFPVREDGSREFPPLSAADLEKVARERGFKAVTVRAEDGAAALGSLAKLQPVLARVLLYGEYLHFVVLRGIEDEWVWVTDPSFGHIRIPLSQFGKVWEEGDRVLLAVSRNPFRAWKTPEGTIYMMRDPSESVPVPPGISPVPLYTATNRLVTFSNAMPK